MQFMQQLMTNLLMLIALINSKGASFEKLMVPISKLLLLTRLGSKADLKSKAIRMAGFTFSLSDKVRSRFKL